MTSTDDPKTLVSTDWLAAHLNDRNIRILDASWYLPNAGRDGKAEYDAAHIPGAQFFDIKDISDQRSDLPHMAPPAEKFITRLSAMGVDHTHQVVVYDGAGLFSAARAWWLFRLMGHYNIAVLNGGLPKWIAEKRDTTSQLPTFRETDMAATHQPHMVRDAAQIAQAAETGDHSIIDARSPGRFKGDSPEPREGMRAGHIPGSKNLHYAHLLNADGTMKPVTALCQAFDDADIDLQKPIITTCGSGVTAAILSLALECMGESDHCLYDGSWSEWGIRADLPIATGAA